MALSLSGDGAITGMVSASSSDLSSALAAKLDASAYAPGLGIIAPSSIAYSGGSASSSGGTTTFTGVSSISLNGVFSATHQNYRIVWYGNGDQNPTIGGRFRARVAGADETGAGYVSHRIYSTSAGASPLLAYAAGQTSFDLFFVGNFGRCVFVTDIAGPYVAQHTEAVAQFFGGSSTDNYYGSGAFSLQSSTQYDGFTLYVPSGSISGAVRVYGYEGA